MDSYQRLVDFAQTHFAVGDPAFRWSAQDYKAVDKIPYIGNLTSDEKNIFVATGFNKWGMSNGSFSSLLITDLITGTPSKYEALFNPSRGEVKTNLGSFIKTNTDVAKEFVKGKVLPDEIELADIKNDEGGIIKYNGKRVAAYRDHSGELFLRDSTCTHLGCELEYNNAERSFDCPCHGSRFNYDGKVIEGAAHTDLKTIEPGKGDNH
jgi:Rieske Fe-S protein